MSGSGIGTVTGLDEVGAGVLWPALDAAGTGILVFNAQGELVIANRPAAEFLDASLAPYLGRHFTRLLADVLKRGVMERRGVGRAELVSFIRGLRRDPSQTFRERLMYTAGGTPCVLLVVSIPLLSESGVLAGRLVMVSDVTRQTRNERLRAEVINMVVHDLRNPLNVVLGNLRLAQEMLRDGVEAGDAMAAASHAAEGMLRLVESMLDINKLKLNLEPVSLQDAVIDAMAMVEELARRGNLSVETRMEPGLPLVMADQGMLQRVLVNLLENAVRFTPDGGRVWVEAVSNGRFVEVRVIDTGPGIPAAARERVFERYVQADNPPVRGHKGSGLGLAFCQLAIEAHGGAIWASEGPEGGAMFVFTLPTDPDASMLVSGNGH